MGVNQVKNIEAPRKGRDGLNEVSTAHALRRRLLGTLEALGILRVEGFRVLGFSDYRDFRV